MDLVNQAIQYDWRCSEKPFLPNRHSLLVWAPSFNGVHHIACGSATYTILRATRYDLGQRKLILRQVPHQIITACRYLYSAFQCGTGKASCDSCRDRVHMRSVDQHEPVARAGIGSRGIVGDWFGKRRIALNQMHRDDAVELLRTEFFPQCGAQSVLAS